MHTPGFGNSAGGVRAEVITARVLGRIEYGRRVPSYGRVLLITPVRGWSDLLRGQPVTVTGELRPAHGGESLVAVLRVRGPPGDAGEASAMQRAAETFREGLRTAAAGLAPDEAGLLPGLVVGDRSELSERVEDDFRVSGMAYLTAVGGWHFMIVCGAVLALLRLLRVPPRVAATGAGLVLLGFLEIAGPRPSVLRAAVMVAAGLLALGTGRARSTVGALSLSIIGLVLYEPSFGVDVGFALSVLATGGLVLLVAPVTAALRRRRVPPGLAELIAVATVAHLVTAPVIAGEFGQFSVVAVLANVLAEPAFVPAMVLGALAMACSPISGGVAGFLAQLTAPFTGWLVSMAHWTAHLPMSQIAWPTGWWGGLALAVAILAGVWLLRLRRVRVLVCALALGTALLVVPGKVVRPGWPPTGWAMVDCDVGQGDAEVLATATPGRAVVVDTGPEPAYIAECLDRLGITMIPLVVLSHLHADHIGGLPAVLAGHSVGAVAVGASRKPSWAAEQVREETERSDVPLVQLHRGERLSWDGLSLRVIGPEPEDALAGASDDGTAINNTSLVLMASTSAGTVLLSGDIEREAQRDLLADGADVRADILKIPHHGSRYSAERFLAAVHPRIAVASVGNGNSYGHPSPVTLRELRSGGAVVLRTDRNGAVAITAGPHGPRAVSRGDPRPAP